MIETLRKKLKKNKFTHKLILLVINLLKLRKIIRYWEKYIFKLTIKKTKKQNDPINLIVASGDQSSIGWISSEWYTLDITNYDSWSYYFKWNEVEKIVAEHVFEHFDSTQTQRCLDNIHKFLKPNGCLRIAVPDGFFPSKKYLDWVKPGGLAPGSEDHKILYNYKTLKEILEKSKFNCILIEFYDENNKFYMNNKYDHNGFISRSRLNDSRNKNGRIEYTSLIIDAYKI